MPNRDQRAALDCPEVTDIQQSTLVIAQQFISHLIDARSGSGSMDQASILLVSYQDPTQAVHPMQSSSVRIIQLLAPSINQVQ